MLFDGILNNRLEDRQVNLSWNNAVKIAGGNYRGWKRFKMNCDVGNGRGR
jgi:hypothetical protein